MRAAFYKTEHGTDQTTLQNTHVILADLCSVCRLPRGWTKFLKDLHQFSRWVWSRYHACARLCKHMVR